MRRTCIPLLPPPALLTALMTCTCTTLPTSSLVGVAAPLCMRAVRLRLLTAVVAMTMTTALTTVLLVM